MAEITRKFALNTRRQLFFVIITSASTRCLVENFRLICYSQWVNAMWQYFNSGRSSLSKWLYDRMIAVVKHCWLLLVQGRRGCREGWQRTTTGQALKKTLAGSLSRRVIVIASFRCLCLKDQLGLCSLNFHTHMMTGNCSASQRVLANSLRVVSAMRGNPPLPCILAAPAVRNVTKNVTSNSFQLLVRTFS